MSICMVMESVFTHSSHNGSGEAIKAENEDKKGWRRVELGKF